MSIYARSRELFERSQRLIPGGVNSPVRAFRAVGGTPVFFREGRGARLFDEDGREYIDYVGSWGPLILGHAHPAVVAAVAAAGADMVAVISALFDADDVRAAARALAGVFAAPASGIHDERRQPRAV